MISVDMIYIEFLLPGVFDLFTPVFFLPLLFDLVYVFGFEVQLFRKIIAFFKIVYSFFCFSCGFTKRDNENVMPMIL